MSISAGDNHNVALKADGTLWTWRLNDDSDSYLLVMDNYEVKVKRNTPIQRTTATDWSAAVSGNWGLFALKKNGTLWAWWAWPAKKASDSENIDTPMQIKDEARWSTIASGHSATFA
jgi:hypothetical protein